MKKKFKLNVLDITIISAVSLIIIVSLITVWKDKNVDKTEISMLLVSDEYYSEIFGEIKNGAEIYNSSSGKLIGNINALRIEDTEQGRGGAEIEVFAEAEEFGGGALIDGDRYYMGDRLSVNVGNSRVVVTVKQLGVRN